MRLKDFREFSDPVMVYSLVRNLLDIDKMDSSMVNHKLHAYICGVKVGIGPSSRKSQHKPHLTLVGRE